MRVIGMMPPAVVAAKTSSASSSSTPRGMGSIAASIPISWQRSRTDRRVMPSRLPRSGVETRPSLTTKMLKPGPSVTSPSRSHRMAVS